MEKAGNPIVTMMMLVVLALGTALSVRPAAADPGHQVQIEHRGLTLNGWLTEAEEPVATIVMLHGTLAHANIEIMATFAEVLSEENIETLRVTLSLDQDDREGMFDCSAPHRHKHGDAVDELAAWLRWLADNGRSQVILLGHSRGTNQVARFAVTASGEGMPIVLVAPSVYRPGGSELSENQSAVLAKARGMVDAGQGEELMHGVDILHCQGADATANSFLSYYDDDPDFYTLRLADAAQVPVLVVLGNEDTLNEGVEEALADLDSNRISVLEVDGADHFFRDLYAYDVAEGVKAWLQEIAGQ